MRRDVNGTAGPLFSVEGDSIHQVLGWLGLATLCLDDGQGRALGRRHSVNTRGFEIMPCILKINTSNYLIGKYTSRMRLETTIPFYLVRLVGLNTPSCQQRTLLQRMQSCSTCRTQHLQKLPSPQWT